MLLSLRTSLILVLTYGPLTPSAYAARCVSERRGDFGPERAHGLEAARCAVRGHSLAAGGTPSLAPVVRAARHRGHEGQRPESTRPHSNHAFSSSLTLCRPPCPPISAVGPTDSSISSRNCSDLFFCCFNKCVASGVSAFLPFRGRCQRIGRSFHSESKHR